MHEPLSSTFLLPSSSETISVTWAFHRGQSNGQFFLNLFFSEQYQTNLIRMSLMHFLFLGLGKIRGSQVKSTFCTHRTPGFSSQNTYSDSQACNSSSRRSSTVFWLPGAPGITQYTYIYTGKTFIHIKMKANLLRGKTKNVFLSISSVCLFSCVQTSKSVGFQAVVSCAELTQ